MKNKINEKFLLKLLTFIVFCFCLVAGICFLGNDNFQFDNTSASEVYANITIKVHVKQPGSNTWKNQLFLNDAEGNAVYFEGPIANLTASSDEELYIDGD